MKSIVNDFTIKIATVNGSGSQTANHILMKCFHKMNIPFGSKNFFPSNIQGMATWFTIRVNEKGFIGHKNSCDILINYNPKTITEDILTLSESGVLFYDQETKLPDGVQLNSEKIYAIPVKAILEEMNVPIKYRKPTSNIIYVGFVAAYLSIPEEVLNSVITRQFDDKKTALDLNLQAARKGHEAYITLYGQTESHHTTRQLPQTEKKVIMDGNTASAMGLLFGGCSFVSWYPITPSTSVIESYKELLEKYRPRDDEGKTRGVIVQSEDELSAICMVLGAGWAGARALTATSGPGLSLMAEAAGYSYYAEIPAVIWNVQRGGPSTGLPTRTAQGDLTFAHFLSHGDTKHICLFPGTLAECFEFGQVCFDLAERLQTLVLVLNDLDLGMNLWEEKMWNYPDRPYDRGKIVTAADLEQGFKFDRYKDIDGDGVPYRTLPGTPHAQAAYFTRGSGHNISAQYQENPVAYQEVIDRLDKKWEYAKTIVPAPVIKNNRAENGLLFYGAVDNVVAEFMADLEGTLNFNTCRVRALPFNQDVENFVKENKYIYIIDQNRDGQMLQLMRVYFPNEAHKFRSLRHYNGIPISADDLRKEMNHVLNTTY